MRPANPWISRLRVAIPLVVALSLTGAFFLLLGQQIRKKELAEAARHSPRPPADWSATPIPPEQYPKGTPTDLTPPALERHGGEFPRWNLEDLPEGWDPELARTIHEYFESMVVDLTDPIQYNRLGELREELSEYLATLGPESVPTLAAILNAEGDFVHRRFLLKALGNLGPQSEAATFVLRDFFMSRSSDPQSVSEMWHVIDAMSHLKNDSSFEVLADFTERQERHIEHHRRHFVEALGDHPRSAEATGIFVDHLHSEREPSKPVRNKAAQALGKVRDPRTLNDLYRAAEQESWWAAKQTIYGSIGKIGNPNSIPFLEGQYREALAESSRKMTPLEQEHNAGLRLSAARAISRIGTPYAAQVLRELQRADPNEGVRGYIEEWVAEIE